MTETKTIWAIVSGSYSEYGIDAVFEDEATAKAWLADLGEDDDHEDERLEEFKFVASGTVPEVEITYRARAEIWSNGVIDSERISSDKRLIFPGSNRGRSLFSKIYPPFNHKRSISVHGTDRKLVMKVFSEKKAMVIANPDYESE
jgi:hypothetical protein